jgi:hypothetical protein
VRLLKLDCEGCEFAVVNSLTAALMSLKIATVRGEASAIPDTPAYL